MRIAILTSGILPVPAVQGGAVENLIDFYLAYNDQHRLHDITVYSVWHPDVEKHPAQQSAVNHYRYVDVTSLRAKLRKYVFRCQQGDTCYYHHTIEYFLKEVMKDIRREKYDIIIMENRPAYSLKLREVTDAKFVYHLHNDNLSEDIPKALPIYDHAYRILTVSNYIKGRVATINPMDTKTRTVYNGINLEAFSQNQGRKEHSSDEFVMVFSGRINEEKGILQLIEAMLLLQEVKSIKLMIIGSSFYGNDNNENPFFRTLKEKAEPLADRIVFTGFIPYAEMPNFLKQADVAVIPSVWDDPFPTTVLEAQAMGLPVISTRRGGIPEEVTKDTAILLDTDESFINNLAAAILDLYQHPEKRRQMAAAALEHSKRFDKENYARNFFAALD